MKQELCIMPKSNLYCNYRFYGSERNEIFGGRNRQKSIKYGLVIFLTPEEHRTGKHSFHLDPNNEKWVKVKQIAQRTWCSYYNKTKEEFIKEFGRSYL